jgi:hypothetical protein
VTERWAGAVCASALVVLNSAMNKTHDATGLSRMFMKHSLAGGFVKATGRHMQSNRLIDCYSAAEMQAR